MSESGLEKIGVIGIGTMGNGIAQVCAQSGFDTVVRDISDEVLATGMANIERSLDRLVKAHEKSDGDKGISEEQKAEALGRLSTTVELGEGAVRLTVEDNGKGFSPPSLIDHPAAGGKLGLIGMHERARLLGGSLAVNSKPGEGTRIVVNVPA